MAVGRDGMPWRESSPQKTLLSPNDFEGLGCGDLASGGRRVMFSSVRGREIAVFPSSEHVVP